MNTFRSRDGRIRSKCVLTVVWKVLIAAVVVTNLGAQVPSLATVSGTLTDPSGAAVLGVEVSARKLDSPAGAVQARSNSDGRFTLALGPGIYRLRFVHPSFARVERDITVASGETQDLPLRLQLEPLAASVIVSAQAEPVTAQVVTAPVTVITREEIEQRQAVSLPNLLAAAPGFSLGRTGPEGGVTSLFLNGGNSNFTKVLVDGTPVNDPGGAVDFSNLTLENVDKVEVVRGAESALFGSDALVGVVQVFTHRGSTRRPQLNLLGEGGNFSSGRGAWQLSGLLGQLDYSAAGAYFGTNGQGPNDRFINRTLSGNFGWRFTDANRVRFSLRNNTSNAGVAGQTLFTAPNLFQHNALHEFFAHLGGDFVTGAHWHHHLAGTESYDRQSFFLSPGFTVPNQFNRAGLLSQSSYIVRQGALTAGYQYEVENGWVNGPHFRRNNQAGFLDAHYQPVRRLMFAAGARAEANDSFRTRVVPRVGVAYLLREGGRFWGAARLRFFYGQGIKEPSLLQSFSTSPFVRGNPNLRPERSRTFNTGVEQNMASDRLRFSVDYFDNRFLDMISFGAGTFFNTDLARARGLNLVIESRPTHWLTAGGNYSYVDSRVLRAPNAFDLASQPGNRLLRRPVHSGNVVLNAAFRRMNWNFAGYFSGRRTDSSFLAPPSVTANPGYARFDFGGSYYLGRGTTVFGRIENLLDRQYQDVLGFPALGRDFRVGVKVRFGGE